jgi:hypothetical protein
MANIHRFILEPYKGASSRHTCPNCGKPKKFTRYIDTENQGEYLAHHVGKCDREEKCSYHYTPSQFFQDNPEAKGYQKEAWKQSEAWKTKYQAPKEQPVQYLPWDILNKTLADYPSNNFVRFLASLFGEEKAFSLAKKYKLGTSKKYQNNQGKAVVFWQIDQAGNIRQAKVMAYHPETGKRIKEEGKSFVSFMGKKILENQEASLQQCFFGEHLLNESPSLPVALVESEKTAVIMAGTYPEVIWLATGGKNGAKWTEYFVNKVLKNRELTIYPDLGVYQDWKEKAKILEPVCRYRVSDLLEQKAQGKDWEAGFDIADFFLKPKEEKLVPASPESLPASFTFFNKTLEYNGLPFGWLNEEEAIQAHKELEGFELEVMKKVNPAVGYLVDKLGLKAEEVVRHPSPSRTRSNKEETTFVLNIIQSREEVKELQSQGRYVYCGRNKGKVSNEGTGFWGNPFPEKLFGLKECIKLHKEWLHNGEEANTKLAEAGSSELIGKGPERLKRVSELKGKALGCYCKPKACHCDYLAELANTS